MGIVNVVNDSPFLFRRCNLLDGLFSVINSQNLLPILASCVVASFSDANLVFCERPEKFIESVFFALCVEQNDVVVALKVSASVRPLIIPSNNFIAEVFWAEDVVHDHFQVMRGAQIAVQIDASGFFQQSMAKRQPFGHVSQISEHAFPRQELAQCADGLLGLANGEQRVVARHVALRHSMQAVSGGV